MAVLPGKKIAFLISLITACMLMPCNASASNVSVGIKEIVAGQIIHLSYPYSIDLYSSMIITVGFKNTGSMNYQERIKVDILNWTANGSMPIFESFFDGYFNLIPGERRTFAANYTPWKSGYHWIHANVTYDGKAAHAWGVFYVRPYSVPVVIKPTIAPGVPVLPVIEIGMARMSLEYPAFVETSKGRSRLVYLTVNNLGGYGNVSLDNVIFYAKSIGIPFTVAPQSIYKIEAGRSGIFLITLNVPREIDAGNYSLDFTVRSDEDEKNGTIKISVSELGIKDDILNIIQNYRFIIERLKGDISQASAEGANVSLAQFYLGLAESGVNDAEGFYLKDEYEKALELLDTARSNLERCVLEIARAREQFFMVFLPAYATLIVLIAVLLSVITVILFGYTRRKKEEREERQEQERIA